MTDVPDAHGREPEHPLYRFHKTGILVILPCRTMPERALEWFVLKKGEQLIVPNLDPRYPGLNLAFEDGTIQEVKIRRTCEKPDHEAHDCNSRLLRVWEGQAYHVISWREWRRMYQTDTPVPEWDDLPEKSYALNNPREPAEN